jgi:hypothetical protein
MNPFTPKLPKQYQNLILAAVSLVAADAMFEIVTAVI